MTNSEHAAAIAKLHKESGRGAWIERLLHKEGYRSAIAYGQYVDNDIPTIVKAYNSINDTNITVEEVENLLVLL